MQDQRDRLRDLLAQKALLRKGEFTLEVVMDVKAVTYLQRGWRLGLPMKLMPRSKRRLRVEQVRATPGFIGKDPKPRQEIEGVLLPGVAVVDDVVTSVIKAIGLEKSQDISCRLLSREALLIFRL